MSETRCPAIDPDTRVRCEREASDHKLHRHSVHYGGGNDGYDVPDNVTVWSA